MKYCSRFFFFKQKTAYEITYGDWSSDVCSSDLSAVVDAHHDVPAVFEIRHLDARAERQRPVRRGQLAGIEALPVRGAVVCPLAAVERGEAGLVALLLMPLVDGRAMAREHVRRPRGVHHEQREREQHREPARAIRHVDA